MPSYKTDIIERLFQKRFNAGQLKNPVVTLADVQAEIRGAIERGVRASDKNAANFLYDIIRKPTGNDVWPRSVFEAGYSGRQLLGTGQCFEFVKVREGAKEPFPNNFASNASTPSLEIQSLSMPLLVRELAATDEMAILQTAIALRLLETHFALRSSQQVIELTLLQMSVRFSNVMIDGLFAALIGDGEGGGLRALITCEAKQQDERILEERLIRQVQSATEMPLGQDCVIATVVQRAPQCSIYIAEFQPVPVSQAVDLQFMEMASSGLYVLKPPLSGFG